MLGYDKSSLRDPTLSTLSHLDSKYNATGRGKQQTRKVKVFDDDASEDEDEERIFAGEDGLDGSGSGSDDEDEGDSEDDESEDEEEDEGEDEDEEDQEESENHDTAHAPPIRHRSAPAPATTTTANGNGNTKLDPVAAIRASKNKEVEKGRAILRQQVSLLSSTLLCMVSFADLVLSVRMT
ncbi:hypothetical protein QFC22_003139 [Naganishia vaughanmartiniae]|uniref:Uncharacterized protein n=1 Tax=Naganishia vaughanmartiniae TaxID=1424756 RepID=A0ACC2XA51_9TREE|nr:hypothetical protein QFC22_003139 [Naganishia vaughanmartiniae]